MKGCKDCESGNNKHATHFKNDPEARAKAGFKPKSLSIKSKALRA
jgi:hypothetical protein